MEALLGPVFSRLTSKVMDEQLVTFVDIPPYKVVYNAELCGGKWVDCEFGTHEVRLEGQDKYWVLWHGSWVNDGNFAWP